jgi:hypothetical protein
VIKGQTAKSRQLIQRVFKSLLECNHRCRSSRDFQAASSSISNHPVYASDEHAAQVPSRDFEARFVELSEDMAALRNTNIETIRHIVS